ncbi:MAG TPA: TonB family protein [Bradyrhizobium sp.]|nr:TonB family protein [Bradyrhizobium sp.]
MSEPELEQKSSRRLWIFAAVGALVLHLGGVALAVAHLQTKDDDGLGANGAEYAVEMASPDIEEDDLPPGPDADASQASPQLTEQKTEVKETDLPKDQPHEDPDPDQVVTTNDSKKPVQDDPKVAAVQTEASEEAPAQEATARQTLEEKSPDAQQPKAPNLGIGKDKLKLTANWGRKISAYFDLHKRYPRGENKTTTVKVNLVLNRRGNVVSASVAESSGDPVFDEAALAMIHRSDPVPAPPAGLTDDQFAFSLDVKFNKPK